MAAIPREGEGFEWWGAHFTKKKSEGLWVGWFVVCKRHSTPTIKCSRTRTLGIGRAVDRNSDEALAANELAIAQLKYWVAMAHTCDSKTDHMRAPDTGPDDLPDDGELERMGTQSDLGLWGTDDIKVT